MRRARPLVLAGLALLALACAQDDPGGPRRRPITPPPASGWARLPLDAAAQRDTKGLWISDAAGRSVPFLVAREGLWASQPLALDHLLLGADREGRPAAEFGLKLPEGWQVGEREQLRLDFDLEGAAPWVATVAAERERQGGAFLAYTFPAPVHLYDLSPSGSRASLTLPWDGERYRITLRMDQGAAPRIKGLRVFAETRPEALEAELALDATLAPEAGRPREWRLALPQEERIVGLEVGLTPPAAPLRAEVAFGEADDFTFASEPLWNLPALGSRATRIALPPTLARTLRLRLPEGATPTSVRVLVRRQTLLFPAEGGRAYALHLGGEARPAPGDLGALPSSRALIAAAPLALGPEAPDPDGLPRRVTSGQRARPWMPWVAGAAVLLLGLAAWRLFREGEKPAP
jgi:hypothetical protein